MLVGKKPYYGGVEGRVVEVVKGECWSFLSHMRILGEGEGDLVE